MTILVTGGSKCGKSSFAESLAAAHQGERIYIATMQPYGEEAFSAIERHRKMRLGKGFVTVEKYTDIDETAVPENSFVLLECMGNLLANEMFRDGKFTDPTERIIAGTRSLAERAAVFVMVTNQIGSDGIDYSAETNAYISALGRINSAAAQFSDVVVECIYGLPVFLKGSL